MIRLTGTQQPMVYVLIIFLFTCDRKSEISADADSVKVTHTEAFDIERFFNKALEMETANNAEKLLLQLIMLQNPIRHNVAVEWSTLDWR